VSIAALGARLFRPAGPVNNDRVKVEVDGPAKGRIDTTRLVFEGSSLSEYSSAVVDLRWTYPLRPLLPLLLIPMSSVV
jgi:hypothetical protein